MQKAPPLNSPLKLALNTATPGFYSCRLLENKVTAQDCRATSALSPNKLILK